MHCACVAAEFASRSTRGEGLFGGQHILVYSAFILLGVLCFAIGVGRRTRSAHFWWCYIFGVCVPFAVFVIYFEERFWRIVLSSDDGFKILLGAAPACSRSGLAPTPRQTDANTLRSLGRHPPSHRNATALTR